LEYFSIFEMTDSLGREQKSLLLSEAIRILDAWHVSGQDQPDLLGLSDKFHGRAYNRVRLGTQQPQGEEVYERARLINRIHQATLTLFPFSEDSANLWVQVPQRPFGGKSALDIMRKHGLSGMRQVDLAVDNQYHPLTA